MTAGPPGAKGQRCNARAALRCASRAERELGATRCETLRTTIEDIRAFGAPAGDEALIEKLLTAQEEGTERVAQDPLSIFEEDEPSEADRLAADYGLDSCGDTDCSIRSPPHSDVHP